MGHALLLSGRMVGSDVVVAGNSDVDVVDVLNVGGSKTLIVSTT
jgi:hypothetical protein